MDKWWIMNLSRFVLRLVNACRVLSVAPNGKQWNFFGHRNTRFSQWIALDFYLTLRGIGGKHVCIDRVPLSATIIVSHQMSIEININCANRPVYTSQRVSAQCASTIGRFSLSGSIGHDYIWLNVFAQSTSMYAQHSTSIDHLAFRVNSLIGLSRLLSTVSWRLSEICMQIY